MYTCAYMYVNAQGLECMCTCIWRPEVKIKSLPRLLSAIFRARSLSGTPSSLLEPI